MRIIHPRWYRPTPLAHGLIGTPNYKVSEPFGKIRRNPAKAPSGKGPTYTMIWHFKSMATYLFFKQHVQANKIYNSAICNLCEENRPIMMKDSTKFKRWSWVWGVVQSNCLTHFPLDKIAAISHTTCLNVFSWMKMMEFRLKFHWSLFLWVLLTISEHWFRWWLGTDQATSNYLNQCWPDYWHICGTRGRWVNNLSLNKMAAILQTTFSNTFSWMNSFVSWFVPKFQLTISQHWFR